MPVRTAVTSAVLSALLLGGCATSPPPSKVLQPAPAPAVPSLQQLLQEAGQAGGEGLNKERARELYRAAARSYPTSKEPWVKLAEDYFEAANYGQAILAAQEVIQRDPQDSIASSVLAVSGLRVSAAALATLREQNTRLAGGTRSEAQSLAKVLRDALGEAELIPQATPATTGPAPAPRNRPRPVPRPTGPAARTAADGTALPVPATAPRPPGASSPALPSQQGSVPPRAAAVSAPGVAGPTPAASTARAPAPAVAADPFKILKK